MVMRGTGVGTTRASCGAVMIVLQMASRTSRTRSSSSSSSPMNTEMPRSANSLANGPTDGESSRQKKKKRPALVAAARRSRRVPGGAAYLLRAVRTRAVWPAHTHARMHTHADTHVRAPSKFLGRLDPGRHWSLTCAAPALDIPSTFESHGQPHRTTKQFVFKKITFTIK